MDAPGLQARHLGGPHIKHVGTSAERASTSPALVVGLQKHHRQTVLGEQRGRRQTGNAGAHHQHIGHRK